MLNQWKKDKKFYMKETDKEFLVVSYVTFVGAENNDYMYGPSLHKINKINYPIRSIDEIARSMFYEKTNEMSLSEKIIFLSAFIGSCEDLEDINGERIWFTFEDKREASAEEVEERILSIIKELDL